MAEEIHLYLVRHAIAAERGEQYPDDAKRPLTDKGSDRFRDVAKGLNDLEVEVDLILTSPLVRARQTADLLAQYLATRPRVVEFKALAPGGSFRAVLDALSSYSRHQSLALVGHEPDMGELAGRLIGTRTAIPFKKGAIARIDVDALPPAAPGRLIWFAPPRMLRALS
jgi:phosphohistidine phosphatase